MTSLLLRLGSLSFLVAACAGSGPPSPSPSASLAPSALPTTAPSSPGAAVSPLPSADAASVAGREFLSVRVAEGPDEIPLVEGTRISVSFRDVQLGIQAGCNSMGGTYRLDGDRLLTDALAMTEMGCDPPRQAQDEWVAKFFGRGPTIQLSGADLTLAVDGRSITFLDREVADPDLALVGPFWTVDTLFSGDAASSVPDRVTATFRFLEDGRVEVDDGCNAGGGRYEVDQAAGTIRFSDLEFTLAVCTSKVSELVGAAEKVLAAPAVTFGIEAGNLRLMAGSTGLGLRGS